MTGELRRYATAAELQRAATEFIARLLDDAIRARGVGTLVLSGGSTPKAIYELLGAEPLRSQLDWNNIHLFWGDERCVLPTHADSNYRMTNSALLEKIEIPDANIHRIQAERRPSDAAELYANEIRNFFKLEDNQLPQFDITLLGMGEDGHTASLFPETTILNETKRLVADVFVPKFNAHRVSMTFPTLNNSRAILFLISGASKAEILRDVLEGAPNRFPAQRVQPTNGALFWFVDDAAARLSG
jgi:6-phosphogluconolactonase